MRSLIGKQILNNLNLYNTFSRIRFCTCFVGAVCFAGCCSS